VYEHYHCSIQEAFERFFGYKTIEEQCTKQALTRLHNVFLVTKRFFSQKCNVFYDFFLQKCNWIQGTENGEMDSSQLYDAFRDILEIKMSQDEFQVLFNKVS